MISTFVDDVNPLGYSDVTCSLPTENKLWHHPSKNSTWAYLYEIPAHFNHQIKTKGYDVIGVNVFLRKWIKFLRKKEVKNIPTTLLALNIIYGYIQPTSQESWMFSLTMNHIPTEWALNQRVYCDAIAKLGVKTNIDLLPEGWTIKWNHLWPINLSLKHLQ